MRMPHVLTVIRGGKTLLQVCLLDSTTSPVGCGWKCTGGSGKQLVGGSVWLAAEKLFQHLVEQGLVRGGSGEQRH